MTQRILVMNGQRLVHSQFDHEWATSKTGKAVQIPPGIYHIHAAVAASMDRSYDGVVLHADQEHLYQQVGTTCVRHCVHVFSKIPGVGVMVSIRYDADQAFASRVGVKQGKGVER